MTVTGLPGIAWPWSQEGEAPFIYILKATESTLSLCNFPRLSYFVNFCFPAVIKGKPLKINRVVLEA